MATTIDLVLEKYRYGPSGEFTGFNIRSSSLGSTRSFATTEMARSYLAARGANVDAFDLTPLPGTTFAEPSKMLTKVRTSQRPDAPTMSTPVAL